MYECVNRGQLWMELALKKKIAHCNATPALAKRKKPLTYVSRMAIIPIGDAVHF